MLAVGDCVTDDVLEEDLEDATGLFVDEAADSLDTTSSGKTSDSGLGDSPTDRSHELDDPEGSSTTAFCSKI